VNTSGNIIFNGTGTSATTLHVNGIRQATTTCRSCHGLPAATNDAPPVATNGTTATTSPKVGAHQKHLTGTTLRTGALACNNCHTVPTAQNHANAAVNVTWNTLATSSAVTPTPAAGVVGAAWEATPTCTNYCHGGKWAANAAYRGATTTVSWTGTAADAQCNDCHLAPPTSSGHSSVTTATNCNSCHSGYGCTSGNLAGCTVNRTIHLNGTFEAPAGGDCIGCHTGTQGARRAIVPEFQGAWSHKRSASPAGSVNKFDCVVCHMEGNLTTGDPDPAFHPMTANGNINLRDPDTGVEILNVTFTAASGTSPGSYANGTGSPAFSQFSRNLGSSTLEGPVQAIMINQCLKCHDANGAQAAWVRARRPARRPGPSTPPSRARPTRGRA
jgi:predicted CxxxxCH...CXXCH cytochrome family protein